MFFHIRSPNRRRRSLCLSRFTLRAKALSFIFFRTDLASTSASDFPGFDQRACGDEARQLSAGEESLLHGACPGHGGIFGMRMMARADFIGIASSFQDSLPGRDDRRGLGYSRSRSRATGRPRPTILFPGDSEANLRAYARMQASTANACLRNSPTG